MNHLDISTKKKITHLFKKGCRILCRPFQSVTPDLIKNRFPFFDTVSLRGPDKLRIQFYTHGDYGTDRIAIKLARYGLSGYELETTRVLIPLVKNAKTMIDVGANTGYFSLLCAGVNPQCVVIAFEPVPFIYEMFIKNIKLNKLNNLIAIDSAVSDRNGYSQFYVTRTRIGIPTDSSLRQGFRDQIEELNLKSITLDEYVQSHQITDVELLKIDVESTEDRVIRGALKIIERDRPFIICEVLKHVDHTYIQHTLQTLEYQFYHMTLSGLKHHVDLQGFQGVNERNYLFVPANRKHQFLEMCMRSNIKLIDL